MGPDVEHYGESMRSEKAKRPSLANVTMETLIETNQRLNRRCQKAEHDVAFYQRRYEAIQKPFNLAIARANDTAERLASLYKNEHKHRYRYCSICRLKWWFKWHILRW